MFPEPMPLKLGEAQIGEVAKWVGAYIAEQRETFYEKAGAIAPSFKKTMEPFFPADVLSKVRITQGRATEPGFYSQLRLLGIRNAPDFSEMAGVTFQDVIVHVEPLSATLLFHELVHAVQYKHLGLDGFAEQYVRGFLTGGSYEEIPLEKQAYELEGRFASDPDQVFSVEDDVLERIRLKRL
jgi:hypothetical protein